ncbi:LamG domain-containing protein [bacterium]|nr:LamG domain-containing protein [bacterium]
MVKSVWKTCMTGLFAACVITAQTGYADLVASIDFDEGSGTTVAETASGLTGTFGFTDAPDESTFPKWVGGATGADGDYALRFDGVNDLLEFKDPDGALQMDAAAGMTLEAYVLVKGPLDVRKIVFGYGLPGGYSFSVNTDLSLASTTYGKADIFSEAIMPNNYKWHNIAAIFDGATVAFYIDGELSDTVDYSSGVGSTEGTRLVVGIESSSTAEAPSIINPFPGAIDRIRIYNEAVDPSMLGANVITASSSADNWELAK